MNILEVRDLKKHYKTKDGILKALDGVSFDLDESEVIGIVGESGSGKSTLAKCVIGLEEPTAGSVNFLGRDQKEFLKKDKLLFRRNAQMIFQNPFDVFNPKKKLKSTLMNTLKVHNILNTKEDRYEFLVESLEGIGFPNADEYLNRYPAELSGGQLQRISILRSLFLNPKLIIADEPVSMLDASIRADILNMLMDIKKNENTGFLYISHDIPTTQFIADKIFVMYLGKIVEYAPKDEIINNPKHPYTKALISHVGTVDPRIEINRIKIKGEIPKPINLDQGCSFKKRCYNRTDVCNCQSPELKKIAEDHYISCFNPINSSYK